MPFRNHPVEGPGTAVEVNRGGRRRDRGGIDGARKLSTGLSAGILFCSVSAWGQVFNACDLNLDRKVDAADVQAAINMTLGVSPCTANLAGINTCNVIVIQRVVYASMGGTCVTSQGLHVVLLSWNPSPSPSVTGYNVYRSSTPGGPFKLLQSVRAALSFLDNTVLPGQVYYYAVTAVDGANVESTFSNQVLATIPVP